MGDICGHIMLLAVVVTYVALPLSAVLKHMPRGKRQ